MDALFGEGVVGQEPLVGEEVEKELFGKGGLNQRVHRLALLGQRRELVSDRFVFGAPEQFVSALEDRFFLPLHVFELLPGMQERVSKALGKWGAVAAAGEIAHKSGAHRIGELLAL